MSAAPVLGAVAFLIATATTPVAGRVARRIGLISRPRPDRWAVRGPVPIFGGGAMVVAIALTLALGAPSTRPMLVVIGAAIAAFALGLLDDIRHLAPSTKLVGQVIIASLLYVGGVRVEIVEIAPVAFMLTVFWVVGMMNALNLMDNMDGLAAGVTAIAAAALALTAFPENPPAAIPAAVTAGAAAGFLIYNFSPARIFMGDSGSQLLGLMLAATALQHTAAGATNVSLALLGPLAVLALPIFDTTLVTISRRLSGRPVSQGGRDHTSHRLARLGLSDRRTVLTLYAVAAILAAVGVLADSLTSLVVPLSGLAVIALVLFGAFLHEVDVYGREAEPKPVAATGPEQMIRRMWVYGRFGAEVILDAFLLTVAYYVSYVIRFEGTDPSAWVYLFSNSVPLVLAAQLALLVLFGVYRTLWRYLGISDLTRIVQATAAGTAIGALAVVLLFNFIGYSRAVFLLDALIAAALIVASRSFLTWLRHWVSVRPQPDEVKVLIVGASDSGAAALRLLNRSSDRRYRVVGFLDDDPGKRYRSVAGIPVVGTVDELEEAIARQHAAVVIVALAARERAKEPLVRAACERAGIECRQLVMPT